MSQTIRSTVRCTTRFTVAGLLCGFLLGLLGSSVFRERPQDYSIGIGWHLPVGYFGSVIGATFGALVGTYHDARREKGRLQIFLFMIVLGICSVAVGILAIAVLNQSENYLWEIGFSEALLFKTLTVA